MKYKAGFKGFNPWPLNYRSIQEKKKVELPVNSYSKESKTIDLKEEKMGKVTSPSSSERTNHGREFKALTDSRVHIHFHTNIIDDCSKNLLIMGISQSELKASVWTPYLLRFLQLHLHASISFPQRRNGKERVN